MNSVNVHLEVSKFINMIAAGKIVKAIEFGEQHEHEHLQWLGGRLKSGKYMFLGRFIPAQPGFGNIDPISELHRVIVNFGEDIAYEWAKTKASLNWLVEKWDVGEFIHNDRFLHPRKVIQIRRGDSKKEARIKERKNKRSVRDRALRVKMKGR